MSSQDLHDAARLLAQFALHADESWTPERMEEVCAAARLVNSNALVERIPVRIRKVLESVAEGRGVVGRRHARDLLDAYPAAERCARDSGWCDGVRCRELGVECPNADPPSSGDREREALIEELADALGDFGTSCPRRDARRFVDRAVALARTASPSPMAGEGDESSPFIGDHDMSHDRPSVPPAIPMPRDAADHHDHYWPHTSTT